VITPQGSVKVLGVTLDKKLTMQAHIAKVADKATYACIALRSIKGLRPNQTRQIYRSCVTPTIDYAASTWYGLGKEGMAKILKPLEKIQRLGARGILRAWKAVSLPVLEAEAYLKDTSTDWKPDIKVVKATQLHAAWWTDESMAGPPNKNNLESVSQLLLSQKLE
jgi:hypothetical protein